MLVHLPSTSMKLLKRMQVGGHAEFLDYVWPCQTFGRMDDNGLPCVKHQILWSVDNCVLWNTIYWWCNTNTFLGNFECCHVGDGVPKVNFKGFMVDNGRANWNAVRRIYKKQWPKYVNCRMWEHISLPSAGLQAWIGWHKNISNYPCSSNTNKYARITRTWR